MGPCLPPESLELLLAGALAEAETRRAREHLAQCPACLQALDRLTDLPQLARWRGECPTAPLPAAPVSLPSFLVRMRDTPLSEAPTAEDGAPVGGAGYSYLRPPQREGDLGMLGPYRLLAELGHGGMGVVFRALDPALNREVALKVLWPERADARSRARFVREARAAAALVHDHVAPVYSVTDPPDGPPYLTMQFVPGPSLGRHLRDRGLLPPQEAAHVALQVAEALACAHRAGLVHRDVKPANVLLDPTDGRAKLVDFGLVRVLEEPGPSTVEGALRGTPEYMSPEQVRAPDRVDGRADVYGLGVTLYEMLTGEVPFRGTPARVLHQVLHEEPAPPRRLNEAVPRDLETVCLKALAKEPARRYPTAGDLADDLRRFLGGAPVRARPLGPAGRAGRWCRRNPGLTALAAALALSLVAGLAGITWKWVEAVQQRDEARRQRGRAEEHFRLARQAVDAYLTRVSEHPGLKSHAFEPLRRELLQTARAFYERLVAEEPDDPALLAELGRAHGRLGLIVSLLESRPRGLEHYEKMQAVFQRLHDQDPANTTYQDELAESFLQRAVACRAMGLPDAAEAAYRRSRALRQELVRAHPHDATYSYQLARTLKELGVYCLFNENNYDRAEQVFREAHDLYARLPAQKAGEAPCRFGRALVLAYLAKTYGMTDRVALHEEQAEAAAALLEPLARDHPDNPSHVNFWADTLNELGDAYRRRGRLEKAEATLRKALAAAEALARRHPAVDYFQHSVADINYNLGLLLHLDRQRPDEARQALGRALDLEEALVLSHPQISEFGYYLSNLMRDVHNFYGDVGRLEITLGRLDATLREREAGPAPGGGNPAPARAALHQHRAYVLMYLGRYSEAASEYRRWLALLPEEQRPVGQGVCDLAEAQVLVKAGQPARAATLAERVAEKFGGHSGFLYSTAVIYAQLAATAGPGDPTAAEYGKRAVEVLRQIRDRKYFATASTRHLLATERALDPLRARADFQRLLAEFEAAQKALRAAD